MFVFYFGILADDTPPVGLAAFAAAAISKGDPIRTGLIGFSYDIRTAILPFLFIFNTDLLLIDVSLFKAIWVFIIASIAMLLFAASTQHYFLTKNRLWESAALMLIAFTLFRPGFWLDQWLPPYTTLTASSILDLAAQEPPDADLRTTFRGEDIATGKEMVKTVQLPLGAQEGDGATRLQKHAGLVFRLEGERVFVDEVVFGGYAEAQRIDFDWEVSALQVPASRPPKEVFYLPALLLLGLIIWLQFGRRRMMNNLATSVGGHPATH